MAAPDAVRPPQVTYAGWAVVLGSLALIVSAFERIASLHSLSTRTTLERIVADQPHVLRITVEDWLRVYQVAGMVSGACAAAGAILGWQALQRSRPARVALLVVAVPLVISSLFSGPVFALLVAVAVAVLWFPAANAWFDPPRDGKMQPMTDAPPPPPPYGQQPSEHQPPPPYGEPQPPQPTGQPYGQPYGQYGQPTGQPYGQYGYGNPAPQQVPYPPQQPYAPPYAGLPVDPSARPGQVTAAAIITMILSGLGAVLGLIGAVVGASAADDVMRELAKQGYDTSDFTAHDLAVGLAVLGGLTVLAGIGAIVAAVFVLRRSHAARVVLTVLAGLTILLSVVLIASLVSVVTLGGAIAAIVLLYQRRSNDWFARRTPPAPYPPYPPVHPGGPWPPQG